MSKTSIQTFVKTDTTSSLSGKSKPLEDFYLSFVFAYPVQKISDFGSLECLSGRELEA